MKRALSALAFALSAVPAFASLPENHVATCDLRAGSGSIGQLDVFSSDNGDEGFLRFAWKATGQGLDGEFTDNVQDEGAAFLKKGAARLYVALEGSKSSAPAGKFNGVAVYLANQDGKIRGKLKADFFEADLRCTPTP